MKKKQIITILSATVTIYVITYLFMTLNGHYEPYAMGLMQGPNDKAILVPKGTEPYAWCPFRKPTREIKPLIRTMLFSPLITFDRAYWHTARKVDSMQYPVIGYFDFKKMEYRNITPE
ncbi:MAG: hypothetical protein PHI84_12360 [Kiritimatiellae bacterium]|nr:hypothetical protein [Kiritimatiellia bacterium]